MEDVRKIQQLTEELHASKQAQREAREAALSVGTSKRWKKWFVENRRVQETARLKWYNAIRGVTGVSVLMSDVEEAWDLLPDGVQGMLEGYFRAEEVGVVKTVRDRIVLFNVKDKWGVLKREAKEEQERLEAERVAAKQERKAYKQRMAEEVAERKEDAQRR